MLVDANFVIDTTALSAVQATFVQAESRVALHMPQNPQQLDRSQCKPTPGNLQP